LKRLLGGGSIGVIGSAGSAGRAAEDATGANFAPRTIFIKRSALAAISLSQR